ncbi:MAG: LSM domain-containing protein [Thermoplasmata archaeon]|jgi:small nuclear ribonucleoprotein|nr:RNA-binding protein [Thermoplasmata archaeon]MVT13309.1 RNA-binding protein [Euryarchaeota archaeon]MVT14361.1 RNA-binding protein [Euryarchaeota archaeon]MVT35349.1 RNA-binding protein [Euryarchaeota archaeon]
MTMPIKVIEEFMNKRISMLMKDNRILEGTLIGFDEYMNLIIDDTEEKMNDSVRKLGVVIVRGNNILRIASK